MGGHSRDAKCLGCTHFCKALVIGNTVTLPIESLAATRFCGLLFPSPLLHTQAPQQSQGSRAPGRLTPHLAIPFQTVLGVQGCLGKGVCSLEGKKVPGKDEAKCEDIRRIRQTPKVFNPFSSSSSPGLIPRGNMGAILL